ncbi:Uncharacterised protein [Mycobacteroides abscessus subsp. abscessus]|nr:Uncharacterised protein [Mycobacteroides abscessus subsp. abscessus]
MTEVTAQGGLRPSATRFIEPHHDIARAIQRELHRFHDNGRTIQTDQRLNGVHGAVDDSRIEVAAISLLDRVADRRPGAHRELQPVMPLVAVGVGEERRAQQGHPHHGGGPPSADVVAVGRVVGDRHPVAGFTHMHPTMRTDLKLRLVP